MPGGGDSSEERERGREKQGKQENPRTEIRIVSIRREGQASQGIEHAGMPRNATMSVYHMNGSKFIGSTLACTISVRCETLAHESCVSARWYMSPKVWIPLSASMHGQSTACKDRKDYSVISGLKAWIPSIPSTW